MATIKRTVKKISVPTTKKVVKKAPVVATAVEEDVDAPVTDDEQKEMVATLVDLVKQGALDTGWTEIYAALEDRGQVVANEENAAAKKAAESGVVAPVATSKLPAKPIAKRVASVVPFRGTQYIIAAELPRVGGAIVEFKNLRRDNENKAVVIMVTGVSGYPEGATVNVPVVALMELPPAKRRTRATAVAPAKRISKTVAKPVVAKRAVRKMARK